MKRILQYVRDFYAAESKGYLLSIGFLVTAILYLNYAQGLEKDYAANHNRWTGNFSGYFLMYFCVFATAFLLQAIFYKEKKQFTSAWFWFILILAPAIFSFRINFHFLYKLVPSIENMGEEFSFTLDHFLKTIVTLVPIYIFWKIYDYRQMQFYGTKRLASYSPYWIMLLIMIPLIAAASTQPDFLQKYPRAHILPGMPVETGADLWQLILYELSYGFNFLGIEFFFRGFLILTLVKFCGTRSIIPVACFYVAIHFGKPLGEAISSFFGGALLGIITYHTRSIWGGLIIHIGIAWLMEIGGAIGRSAM